MDINSKLKSKIKSNRKSIFELDAKIEENRSKIEEIRSSSERDNASIARNYTAAFYGNHHLVLCEYFQFHKISLIEQR